MTSSRFFLSTRNYSSFGLVVCGTRKKICRGPVWKKVRLYREDVTCVRIRRGFGQGCFLSPSLFDFYTEYVGRDGSVGIASRYGRDGSGIESRCGARFSAPVQTGPGAQPASYTMGTVSLSGVVKRPGRDTVHPPHPALRLQKV